MTASPTRSCAGCGRRAAQAELYRFVAREGELTAFSPGDHGRSVYTCTRLQCFERAASRNAFARALRTPLTIDPGLIRLYTDRDG